MNKRWSRDWANSKVLVCGMALSGLAASQALGRLGSQLFLYDSRPLASLSEETRSGLQGMDFTDCTGQDPRDVIPEVDAVVVSPGLLPDLPFLLQARVAGKTVVGELELGYQLSAADFIAITGTNGKTTTTALTGEIFKAGGEKTYVLGNIGDAVCAHALDTQPGDVIVAETAALQLDTIDRFHPFGSAVLNVTPDHLDRYRTMERYTRAKKRVFENQGVYDYCLLNGEDPVSQQIAEEARLRIGLRSGTVALRPPAGDGVFVDDEDWIVWRHGRRSQRIMSAGDVRLPGRHNLYNALFAAGLALEYGIAPETVSEVLRSFAGVEHRLETVAVRGGVTYINDSKGTNPDATMKAVEAVTAPAILILGGFDKHADFSELMRSLGSVRHIVALGETQQKIVDAAREAGFEAVSAVADLEEAVALAHRLAIPGEVVLLSPACASWDMYKNFEERGRHFKSLVAAL